MKTFSNLTDLHNRRRNTNTVAERAKLHNYPYLAWPEDKELLRLADLPTANSIRDVNKPATWKRCEFRRLFVAGTDEILRLQLCTDRAYIALRGFDQFPGMTIAEFAVEGE